MTKACIVRYLKYRDHSYGNGKSYFTAGFDKNGPRKKEKKSWRGSFIEPLLVSIPHFSFQFFLADSRQDFPCRVCLISIFLSMRRTLETNGVLCKWGPVNLILTNEKLRLSPIFFFFTFRMCRTHWCYKYLLMFNRALFHEYKKKITKEESLRKRIKWREWENQPNCSGDRQFDEKR